MKKMVIFLTLIFGMNAMALFVPCAKGDTKCVIRGFKVNGEVINKDENHSFLDCMLSQSF